MQHDFNENLSFSDLRESYSSRYYVCGKMGYIYDSKRNILRDKLCMKWECSYCRRIKRYITFLNALNIVYSFNLNRHMVITFGDNRSKYSYYDSYEQMQKSWDLFKRVIKYHNGNFLYIIFPRAQSDGFCHYHILLNKYINWYWLNKKREKYFGYLSIQKGEDVLEYLTIDFWKDNEWILPKGKRRYSCSREIIWDNYKRDTYRFESFDKYNIKLLRDYVKSRYGRTFNIDEYLDDLIKSKSI